MPSKGVQNRPNPSKAPDTYTLSSHKMTALAQNRSCVCVSFLVVLVRGSNQLQWNVGPHPPTPKYSPRGADAWTTQLFTRVRVGVAREQSRESTRGPCAISFQKTKTRHHSCTHTQSPRSLSRHARRVRHTHQSAREPCTPLLKKTQRNVPREPCVLSLRFPLRCQRQ